MYLLEVEGMGTVISWREGSRPLDSRTGGRSLSSRGESLTISLSREEEFAFFYSSLSSSVSSFNAPSLWRPLIFG